MGLLSANLTPLKMAKQCHGRERPFEQDAEEGEDTTKNTTTTEGDKNTTSDKNTTTTTDNNTTEWGEHE